MKIATVYNNFARGQVDHDLNARSDLPLFTTGVERMLNFFSNFKGNGIFRGGWEVVEAFGDCAIREFKFNETQSYLMVFFEKKMRFISFDTSGDVGFITSSGSIVEVVTPYTLAHSKELVIGGIAQTGDIAYIVHPSYAPYKLTRTGAAAFTLATYSRTADPFTGANKYPRSVCLSQGSAFFFSTNEERTTVWKSKAGDFENMTVGTGADDGFKFTIAGLTNQIDWAEESPSQNGIILGTAQGIVALTGDSAGVITPVSRKFTITNTDGSKAVKPIRKDNLLFYVNSIGRNLNFFNYDLIQESFVAKDANLAAFDITAGGMTSLAFKKDRNNLIYAVRDGKDLMSVNFNQEESIVGWHEHKSEADVLRIDTINSNEGLPVLIGLLKLGTDYFICKLSEEVEFPLFDKFYTGDETADRFAYNLFIAEKLKDCNYLDLSTVVENYYTSTITYTGDTEVGDTGTIVSGANNFTADDVGNRIVYRTETGREYGIFEITGYTNATTVSVKVLYPPTAKVYASWYKSFSLIGGLTVAEEYSVVGDGGYLGDFTVDADGEIDLGREITVAVVGKKYEGLIKTFNLGFATQSGTNTQTTPKVLVKAYIRTVFSAGGEIGTSQYNMTPIQLFNPSGFYDLPPLPIDGTSDPVVYSDDFDKEKCLIIKQTSPVPLHITGIFSEVKYVMGM
jgi:hypothetical protein